MPSLPTTLLIGIKQYLYRLPCCPAFSSIRSLPVSLQKSLSLAGQLTDSGYLEPNLSIVTIEIGIERWSHHCSILQRAASAELIKDAHDPSSVPDHLIKFMSLSDPKEHGHLSHGLFSSTRE